MAISTLHPVLSTGLIRLCTRVKHRVLLQVTHVHVVASTWCLNIKLTEVSLLIKILYWLLTIRRMQ